MQNKKKKTEAIVVDKRPTMAEWPVLNLGDGRNTGNF